MPWLECLIHPLVQDLQGVFRKGGCSGVLRVHEVSCFLCAGRGEHSSRLGLFEGGCGVPLSLHHHCEYTCPTASPSSLEQGVRGLYLAWSPVSSLRGGLRTGSSQQTLLAPPGREGPFCFREYCPARGLPRWAACRRKPPEPAPASACAHGTPVASFSCSCSHMAPAFTAAPHCTRRPRQPGGRPTLLLRNGHPLPCPETAYEMHGRAHASARWSAL